MTGCTPLTDSEAKSIASIMKPLHKALFYLGLTTGLRITELLSLNVGDVYSGGSLKSQGQVKRANTKKKVEGKSFTLIEPAKTALLAYLGTRPNLDPTQPLFLSQKGTRLTKTAAWRGIHNAAEKAGVTGKIGTHSMRKSYAKKVYDTTNGDYMACKLALGHKSVASTESYLQFIRLGEINQKMEWAF